MVEGWDPQRPWTRASVLPDSRDSSARDAREIDRPFEDLELIFDYSTFLPDAVRIVKDLGRDSVWVSLFFSLPLASDNYRYLNFSTSLISCSISSSCRFFKFMKLSKFVKESSVDLYRFGRRMIRGGKGSPVTVCTRLRIGNSVHWGSSQHFDLRSITIAQVRMTQFDSGQDHRAISVPPW